MSRRVWRPALAGVLVLVMLPVVATGAPGIVESVEHDTVDGDGRIEVVLNETVVAADDGQQLAADDFVFLQPFSGKIDHVGDPSTGDVYRVAGVLGNSSTQRRLVVTIERYNQSSGLWEPYPVPPTAGLEMNLSAVESTATGTVVDPQTRPVAVTSWDVNRGDTTIDTPGTALPVKRGSVLALDAEGPGFNVTVFDESNGSVVFGTVNTGPSHTVELNTSGLETGGATYRVRFERNGGLTNVTRYFNVSTLSMSLSPNRGTFYLGEHDPIAGLVQTNRTGRPPETVSGRLDDSDGVPIASSIRFQQPVDATGFRNLTFMDPVDIPRTPVTGDYTVRVVDDLTTRTLSTTVTVACGRISGPTVIDDPGCYVVNASATDSTASTYVDVTASNVSVFGQDHTIDGVDASGSVGVAVGSGTERVAVQNLTLRDFENGVVAVNATAVRLRAITGVSNTFAGVITQLGGNVTVDGGTMRRNGAGVYIDSTPGVDILGTSVENNTDNGVEIANTLGTTLRNVSTGRNGGHGVAGRSSRDLLLDTVTAAGNGGSGLYFLNVSGSTVTGSSAGANAGSGVTLNRSDGNEVVDTTLSDNGRFGISVGGVDAGSHDNRAGALEAIGNALAAVRIRGPDFDPSTNNSLVGVDVGSGVVGLRGTYVTVNTSSSPPPTPAGWFETGNYALVETLSGIPSQADLGLAYTDGDISGLDESSLAILQHRGGTWNETGSTLRPGPNRVETTLSTDGVVGVFAAERRTVPELSLSKTSLDFGTTAVGTTAVGSVTATNTGNATLALDPPTLAGTTRPYAVRSAPSRLAPGESARVTVEFSPRSRGDKSATMTIPTNASDGTVDLAGTGVRVGASVSPGAVDFGTLLVGENETAGVTVANTGDVALDLEAPTLTGTGAGAYAVGGSLPATLQPGAAANLSVIFAPMTNGTRDASLVIGVASPLVGPLTTNLSGRAVARSLAVSRSVLDFGDVPPGTTVTRQLTLENDGGNPIEVTGTLADDEDGDFATATSGVVSLASGERATVNVTYAPGDFGGDNASLAFTDSAGITHTVVALRGAGRGGKPIVRPRSISFTNASVGETVHRTVFVENAGNEPLSVTATPLVGPEAFGLANGGAFTLAPGAQRRLNVSYTPNGTAPTAGLLRVLTADDRLENATVYLSNTPTVANVSVVERDGETGTNVTVLNATAGDPVTIPVADEDVGRNLSVESITVIPTVDTTFWVDVTTGADPLPGTPTFRLGDGTTPLGHLSISHNLSNADIATVRFRYRVRKRTLASLATAPEAVSLYRYRAGEWVPKPTTVLGERDGFAVLRTTADALSEWTAAARRPRFNVSDTATSIDSGVVGDDVVIRVFVRNTGGADGVYVAKLLLNGEVVDRREATIPDGGKRALVFERSFEEPGDYQIEVNDVFVGEVTISQSNESVDVDTDATPPDGGDGGEGGDTQTDEQGGGGGLPILPLVLVAALAVLGVGAWLVFGREEPAAPDGPVDSEASETEERTVVRDESDDRE